MSSKKGQDIYSGLFEIVSENQKRVGKEMEFQKQTFLSTVGEEAQITDLSKWRDCDIDSFLENAYFQLLERMPDRGARNRWKNRAPKKKLDYQRAILISVLNSQEFMMKSTCFKNNIYGNIQQTRLRIRIKNNLFRLGRKLPKSIKQAIKKICGIG